MSDKAMITKDQKLSLKTVFDKADKIVKLKAEIKKVFNKEPKLIEASVLKAVLKLHVDEVTTSEIVGMDKLFTEHLCHFTLRRSGTGISILIFC